MKLRLFMYLGLLCGGLYSCNDDPTPLPTSKNFITKLLQKSGIRKNEVIELIYRGFI